MSNQKFKKLRRQDLLELLLEQSKEIESLERKLSREEGENSVHVEKIERLCREIEEELKRERYHNQFYVTLRSTIVTLLTVAAVSILVLTLWMPILRLHGSSMEPSLTDGEIVVSMKDYDLETGDVVAFYYNNKILVKRCIAVAGDWVDIKTDGTVLVNGKELVEPYVSEKELGRCDLSFPYEVPESRIFVLGDHRSVSVDSRSSEMGCVSKDQLVGHIVLRIWPLSVFGPVR